MKSPSIPSKATIRKISNRLAKISREIAQFHVDLGGSDTWRAAAELSASDKLTGNERAALFRIHRSMERIFSLVGEASGTADMLNTLITRSELSQVLWGGPARTTQHPEIPGYGPQYQHRSRFSRMLGGE